MLAQVEQLCDQGTIKTVSGDNLKLQVYTLCVHGDNIESVQDIQAIRAFVHAKK